MLTFILTKAFVSSEKWILLFFDLYFFYSFYENYLEHVKISVTFTSENTKSVFFGDKIKKAIFFG